MPTPTPLEPTFPISSYASIALGGYIHSIGFYQNDNLLYFSWSISFQIPEAKEEVEQWETRWLCLDADEQ